MSKRITDIQLVTEDSPGELTKAVAEYLPDWQPYGPIISYKERGRRVFVQQIASTEPLSDREEKQRRKHRETNRRLDDEQRLSRGQRGRGGRGAGDLD